MLDDKKLIVTVDDSDKELDTVLDSSAALVPLDVEEEKILRGIIAAPTKEELERQFQLFNQNQVKKNAYRIVRLNKLLDSVEDQAIKRFAKNPGNISNKDVLDYMQVVANQIDKAQKSIEVLNDKPMIKITENKQEVNINLGGPQYTRDNKEHVIDAIQSLLKQLEKQDAEEAEVVDVDVSEPDASDIKEQLDELDNDLLNTDDAQGE